MINTYREFNYLSKSSGFLKEKLAARGPALPKIKESALSALSKGSVNVVSGGISGYRGLQSVVVNYLDAFPSSAFEWMKPIVSAKGVTLTGQAFGAATGSSVILNAVQLNEEWNALQRTNAIGDKRGSLIGRINVAKSGVGCAAATSFVAFRPLTMMALSRSQVTGLRAPTLLGRVTYGVSFVGMIFYAIFYVLASAVFGINTYEAWKLKQQLKKAGNLDAKMTLLERKLNVDEAKLRAKFDQKALEEEGLAAGKTYLREMMKELGMEEVSERDLEAAVKKIVGDLEAFGLREKIQKVSLKKRAKLERVIGKEGIVALEKLSAPSTDKEESVRIVEKNVSKSLKANVAMLALLVLGVATMVMAVTSPVGVPLLVASALMLVFTLASMIVDGLDLAKAYKESTPTKHDKKMLLVSSVLGVISFLSAVVFAGVGVMSMGTVPMIVTIIVTALWLGQNGVTWAVINRNQRRNEEENPTLEILVKAFEKGEKKERIEKMLENLSGEIRLLLEQKTAQDKPQAIVSVAKRIEKVKKDKEEMLRRNIRTHLPNFHRTVA